MKPTRKQREKTAYHEAGHAVIGRVLTLKCGSATMKPDYDEGSFGHAITADPYECMAEWEKRGKMRGQDAIWHARIMCFMAGAEAESKQLGARAVGDGYDRDQIRRMSRELTHRADRGKLQPRLRAMTRYRVRKYWTLIERVAEALLTKTELSATELDKLVGRSVDDVGPRRMS